MTVLDELKEILQFDVPLHERFTESFKREIIDFPLFAEKYRASYGRQENTEFYAQVRQQQGARCVDLLLTLT